MPLDAVVALAGPISSGKSSVAGLLGARYGAAIFSFGQFVRKAQPPEAPREHLQLAGAALLERLGPEGFVRAVCEDSTFSASAVPAIWEGVRHPEILEPLTALYSPVPLFLFFLAPPESERRGRALEEAGSDEMLTCWEADPTEATAGLRARADLVVEADTPEAAADKIVSYLESKAA